MKILIVSFIDDNFGDNLIKICFEALLKVALENHGIKEYEITQMSLKKIDRDLVKDSDFIFFAGGGLFGLSYLNFFDYINEIALIAEEGEIPVIFSSLGINNMDATEDAEQLLKNILKKKCIKAISVRENFELFQEYSKDCSFEIESACDPAVWTKYVYGMENASRENVVGINVVRGGLFKDNKKNWRLTDELNYLYELKSLLDESGIEYTFYTNGSLLDNNTLRYFARKYSIPASRIDYVQTTRELVEAVSRFNAIAAFRMHTSIIAYSFNIPSIAMIWNDKIPFFYQQIGHPDRALEPEVWSGEMVFERLQAIRNDTDFNEDKYKEYLMSLYVYLYRTISKHILGESQTSSHSMFTFEEVARQLVKKSVTIDEDEHDLRFKLDKAERQYLNRFVQLRKKDKELQALKAEISSLKKKDEELDRLNNLLAIRFFRRLKRPFG